MDRPAFSTRAVLGHGPGVPVLPDGYCSDWQRTAQGNLCPTNGKSHLGLIEIADGGQDGHDRFSEWEI